MTRTAIALCLAIFWPGVTLASPSDIGQEQEATAALLAAIARAPATKTLHGRVDSVDERNNTILIRLPSNNVEPFKVQDGLIFNAIRFGDSVEISVQNISGFRTIVSLSKE